MRLTIDVDDESFTRAAALTGMDDQAALIRRALELLARIDSRRPAARRPTSGAPR